MDTDIIIHSQVIECKECGEFPATEDHFDEEGSCIWKLFSEELRMNEIVFGSLNRPVKQS